MDGNPEASRSALEDALHTLAQPLTAIAFSADMALLKQSPDDWRAALETIQKESGRAIDALRAVRDAVTTTYTERGE